jgi:putative phosphoesterase
VKPSHTFVDARPGRRRTTAGATTDLLLIADTHLGPGRADRLLERIDDQLDHVDVIVHAGDITDVSVLEALACRVPGAAILAVKGNNDVGVDLPERVEAEVGGCLIGVVHDSGPRAGRRDRLRRWFPSCDLVVFGHSHLPWHEIDVFPDGHVQHQVNPGSPLLRRRAPTCTTARVVVSDGVVTDVRHVDVAAGHSRC